MPAQAATGHPLPPLTSQQHGTLDTLVQKRLDGIPLAHLTGRQRFMDVELLAGAQALDSPQGDRTAWPPPASTTGGHRG
jgi:release factor glutamine methyltransferase